MSEKLLSKNVVKWLKGMDPIPVDNPRRAGTPDINFIEGWLELKYLPKWPKRAATKVKIKSWTKKQMIWHNRRTSLGGRSFILLQVGNEYILFDGSTGILFNEMTQTTMKTFAIRVWDGYPGEKLCKYLQ